MDQHVASAAFGQPQRGIAPAFDPLGEGRALGRGHRVHRRPHAELAELHVQTPVANTGRYYGELIRSGAAKTRCALVPGEPRAISPLTAMPILFLIVLIDLIGFGLVIPLLPFYAERFAATPQEVTVLMATFSAMQTV